MTFRSKNPLTNTTPGKTGVLFTCGFTHDVAPCVVSSKQVKTSIVVVYLAPGGDPVGQIAFAGGTQISLGGTATIKVGDSFNHEMAVSGLAPYYWIIKGRPPPGISWGGRASPEGC